MDWQRLIAPPERPWHSKKTAKERAEIAAEVEELQKQRNLFDQHRQKLQETPLEELESNDVFQYDCPSQNRFELLRRELKLRERIALYYLNFEEPDRSKARSEAAEAVEAKRSEIAGRLESIGYKPFNAGEPVPGAWNPGMVQRHPEFLEALEYHRSFAGDGQELRRQNEQAFEAVQEDLKRLRNQAIAA